MFHVSLPPLFPHVHTTLICWQSLATRDGPKAFNSVWEKKWSSHENHTPPLLSYADVFLYYYLLYTVNQVLDLETRQCKVQRWIWSNRSHLLDNHLASLELWPWPSQDIELISQYPDVLGSPRLVQGNAWNPICFLAALGRFFSCWLDAGYWFPGGEFQVPRLATVQLQLRSIKD